MSGNSLSRTACPHPYPKFTGSPPLLPLVSLPSFLSGSLSFLQQPSPQSVFFSPATLSPLRPPRPNLFHPLLHVPFITLLPPPPTPFPPPPRWGGGPGGLAPSPARLRQRWWRVAVSASVGVSVPRGRQDLGMSYPRPM